MRRRHRRRGHQHGQRDHVLAGRRPGRQRRCRRHVGGFRRRDRTDPIPTLSWFGLLALAAAIGLLGAAMTLRAR
jgi:hypothetical protein